MPLKVIVGSTTKDVARAQFYPSTSPKRVTRIEAWNGSAWKLVQSFAPPMSLSIAPASAEGEVSSPFPATVDSNVIIATPSGGIGPFSYSWSVTGPIAVNNPTNAGCSFSATCNPGQTRSGTATCTATDSLGTVAVATAPVILRNNSEA